MLQLELVSVLSQYVCDGHILTFCGIRQYIMMIQHGMLYRASCWVVSIGKTAEYQCSAADALTCA